MQFCFALPVRDKAKYLAKTVNSILRQDYSPLEILLSDQGSVDGSWEILKDIKARYDGPHSVRVVQCPHIDIYGMPALNEHLNWMHNQTDATHFLSCSADDLEFPQRTRLTVNAFKEFDPSMVMAGMVFMEEDGMVNGATGYPIESGWIKASEMFARYIGGSTVHAWTRDIYEKVGGLQGVASPDMVLPMLATIDKGAYFIADQVHAHRRVVDSNNTGLEGVIRAATTHEELMQLEELCHFQITAAMFTIAQKMKESGLESADATKALIECICSRAGSWQTVRQKMAIHRVRPIALKS